MEPVLVVVSLLVWQGVPHLGVIGVGACWEGREVGAEGRVLRHGR
jgi:hypothetical protein